MAIFIKNRRRKANFAPTCLSLTKKILSHQDRKRERPSLYAAHICRAKILMWVKSISAEYFASSHWHSRAVRRLMMIAPYKTLRAALTS